MSYLDQVELARRIATRAHHGQLDKIGALYIEHPAMVVSFVRAMPEFAALDEQTQSDAVAAAWLHDVIEDTEETAESLLTAGISDRAVSAVVVLTRTDDLTSEEYYEVIKVLPVPLLVKTADLASNLAPERVARLDEHSRARLARKYGHALEVLGVDRSVITALHDGRSDQ